MPSDVLTIRQARPDDASALATLMTTEIHWGRIASLGSPFITLLHSHLIDSEYSHCPIAVLNGEVVGYVAWVHDRPKFFRDFVRRRGLAATRLLLPQIFRRSNLDIIVKSLSFFNKPPQHKRESIAELVSVAVSSKHHGMGIASKLFAEVRDEMRAKDISELTVGTVAVDNVAANNFYRRLGFVLVQTIPFYADTMVNVYVFTLK